MRLIRPFSHTVGNIRSINAAAFLPEEMSGIFLFSCISYNNSPVHKIREKTTKQNRLMFGSC